MAQKIKKGDSVYVISGDNRGMRGTVVKVLPKESKVFVDGVNLKTRHMRPSAQNPDGGKVSKPHPLHISNVALVDPEAQEGLHWTARLATRVGFRLEGGEKVRYAKRSGKTI